MIEKKVSYIDGLIIYSSRAKLILCRRGDGNIIQAPTLTIVVILLEYDIDLVKIIL